MENDNTMKIIYMLMIAVFISTSVIYSYKGKFKLAAKHLLIWFSILSITFIGFSYRENFLNIKDNIVGELFPSSSYTNDAGEIIIHKSMGGHFYIDIEINGVILKMMVDTGASRIVLSKRDSFRIGINTDELRFNNMVYTANGTAMTAPITIPKLYIDGIEFRNISASVNNSDMQNSLLGMSFLNKLQSFTVEKNRLIMQP